MLTGEGGEIFYKLTSDNVEKTLAVVLGDKVKSQARIAEPIRDSVRVTGFDPGGGRRPGPGAAHRRAARAAGGGQLPGGGGHPG